MVDNRASVKFFNDKFFSFVMFMNNLNSSWLDHIHFITICVKLVEVTSLLKINFLHVVNPFHFHYWTQVLEEVDLVQTNFKEYFERIIVNSNVFLYQINDLRIKLLELVKVFSADLSTCTVVHGFNCCTSFAVEQHRDLSEMITCIKNSANLRLTAVNKLVDYSNFTFTFSDEENIIICFCK